MDELVCIREAEGQAALLGRRFILRLEWKYPVDLDLAAVCVTKTSDVARLVYHGDTGARQSPPWARLSRSVEGDGRTKDRWEKLIITDASKHDEFHIFAWDHDAVEAGRPSAFAEAPESYELSIVDETNGVTRVVGREHQGMNCVNLASISLHSGVKRTDAGALMYKPEARRDSLLAMIS